MRYQLFLLIFILSGCSLFSTKSTNSNLNLTGTRWVMHTLNSESIPNLSQSIYLEFTSKDRKRFTGFAGCNEIFGEYSLNPNKILFDKMGSTRKTCYHQDLENNFLEMLKNSTHFKIRGHQLSFYQGAAIVGTFTSM